MVVEMVDQIDEGVPIRNGFGSETEQLVVVPRDCRLLRNAPDLQKAAIVGKDVSLEVDYEDTVRDGLLLRPEDAHGRLQRFARATLAYGNGSPGESAASIVQERCFSGCQFRGVGHGARTGRQLRSQTVSSILSAWSTGCQPGGWNAGG